ncbi:MAG: glycosyltransferase family 9 protein [Gemmatimonadota bacterium]|nr:glycosyltransferase family 9 protein [Gemmatimonadota bacterium]
MPHVRRLLKGAESVLQRELIRVASVPARLRRASVDLGRPRRILVVRHDWIGDMILSTGALRRIKEVHPETDVDVVASPSNAVVLEGLSFVRRVFVHRQGDTRHLLRLRRELRAVGYDAALNGRVLRPKLTPDTALTLLASGAPRRVGVVGGGADFLYTDPVVAAPDAHFVRHMAALTEPFGLDPDAGDWRPAVTVHARERGAAERLWAAVGGEGRKLLVNISARTGARRWPDERFVEALRRLRAGAPDVRLLVISPSDEYQRARAIADAVGATAAKPLLRETFALVDAADMIFTPDTSIAHVASVFSTPTVVMFVPGWTGFIPYRTPGRYICATGPTLDALPVEPVVAALELVYAAGRGLEPECLPFSADAPRPRAAVR